MTDGITLGLMIGFCLILIGLMALKVLPYAVRARFIRPDPALSAHLKSHIVATGPLDGPLEAAFPADFYNKKLILLGEIHGYGAMAHIDYELLTHLNERIGLKDYLAEHNAIEAACFNAYLDTGDEAHLERVFRHYKGVSRWANQDFWKKLQKLKAFNDSLPADARIRFTGIDTIQNLAILSDWLGMTPTSESPPIGIWLAHVEAANAETLTGGAQTKAEVIRTLKAMAAGLEREAIIFDNYAFQVREGPLKDRPAYGLWHTTHVLKTQIDKGFTPFAARVAASDLPAAKSVATIAAWSDRGEIMTANNEFKRLFASKVRSGTPARLLENDGPVYYLEGLGDLRAGFNATGRQRNGVAIFDLGGDDSPFASATNFAQLHTFYYFGIRYDSPQKPVSAVFDYAMLVRGSPAAQPLNL